MKGATTEVLFTAWDTEGERNPDWTEQRKVVRQSRRWKSARLVQVSTAKCSLVGRLWNDMRGAESCSYGERFWSRSFKPPLPSFPRLLLEHENKNNTSALTRIWNQSVPKKAGALVPAAFSQRHAWFFLSTRRSLFDCRCLIDVGLNGSES